jgi:ATP-dependent DNA helicase Q1
LNAPSASQIKQVVNGFSRPSVQTGSASRRNNDIRQDLITRRAGHEAELERLDEELLTLEDLRRQEIQNIKNLTQQIDSLDEGIASGPAVILNYFDEFEWSERMREQMRKVFGIENFRLAQEGYVAGIASSSLTNTMMVLLENSVCNANMDGRDIICIMPTGQRDFPLPVRVVSTDVCMDHHRIIAQEPGSRSHTSYLRR